MVSWATQQLSQFTLLTSKATHLAVLVIVGNGVVGSTVGQSVGEEVGVAVGLIDGSKVGYDVVGIAVGLCTAFNNNQHRKHTLT